MIKNNNVGRLKIPEDCQTLEECLNSIEKTGTSIRNSDMTSTFIVEMRILSMRTLLNLLEVYNNQLKDIEKS